MKRAAIYARYSTDLQNDASVEDQIRLCREYAGRLGLTVVAEYHDRAKSGASMFGRPGLASLMQAAEHSVYEFVVAESPDRLSRDIADLGTIHKQLTFRGIELQCVNGGKIDTMQVGLYGLVGQMQREEGAKKVRRGMVGVVQSGRSAGGRAYGYRPVPGKPGELEIVAEEAEAIRRIFDLYSIGVAPRTIAAKLNEDRVPAPRGAKWNASTINGNGKRGHGILRNPLYTGEMIWNRVRMVKDPMTGKRVSRVNDASEHQHQAMPHLAIIDRELFERVQKLKEERGGERGMKVARSKRPLSGLLKCGACGGGMGMIGPDRSGFRIQCTTHRESGSCDNGRRYYVEKIEKQVFDSLRMQFANVEAIEAYVTTYQEEQRKGRAERNRLRSTAEKAMQEAKDEITEVIRKMSKKLIDDDEAVALLTPLREIRDYNKALLESNDPPETVIEIKPKAIQRFRENIENFVQIVQDKDDIEAARMSASFREIIARVIVHPCKPGEPYSIQIKGFLSKIADATIVGDTAGSGRGT